MARRGGGEGAGMAAPLIGVAVNLLVFVILEIFAPTIAGTIQAGQPNLDPTSEWNNTFRTDPVGTGTNWASGSNATGGGLGLTAIPTGVDTWTTVIQIIGVVFLIIAIAIAIYYLKGMG